MMDARRWMVAGLVAVALSAAPQTAVASEEFVQAIKTRWRVERLPVAGKGCRLCHESESGGRGTVKQPFGKTLFNKAHVVGTEVSSLVTGLNYVVQNHTNSDGDPVPDYEEIVRDFTNPNDAQQFVPPPETDPGSGEGGATSSPGAGGDGAVSPPDDYPVAPSPDDLPPPFHHGCSVTAHTESRRQQGSALFVVALAVLRRGRRTRGAPHRA
jgi:hypothetical protein